jgi:hypothetical protein
MLHIADSGTGRAGVIWSIAALVAEAGRPFGDLLAELQAALGREPELDETMHACRIARAEVTASHRDDVAVGAWMMLCRLAGRIQEPGIPLAG